MIFLGSPINDLILNSHSPNLSYPIILSNGQRNFVQIKINNQALHVEEREH